MNWQDGRQGTGYKKLKIFESKRLEIDCWMLRYDVGASIPIHIDPVQKGKKHYRLNFRIRSATKGGYFKCVNVNSVRPCGRWWRFILFRPDLIFHSVSPVYEGTRLVLSIGWLINDKSNKTISG